MTVRAWLVLECRLLFIAVCLLTIPSGFANAAESEKRLAFSKKLGIEVFARGNEGGGSWCKEIVTLDMQAREGTFYESEPFKKLAPKLGGILAKECPTAISAMIKGTAEGASELIFQGRMQKEKQWELEPQPIQPQSAALNAPPPPLPPNVIPLANDTNGGIGGVWKGSYICGRRKTDLTLTIKPEGGNRVSGVFAFFLKDGRYGRFKFSGQYDPISMKISGQPGEWLTKVPGFNSVPFNARLSPDGNSMTGRVIYRGCGGLVASRKSKSVNPPVTETAQTVPPTLPSSQNASKPISNNSISKPIKNETLAPEKKSKFRSLYAMKTDKERCEAIHKWVGRFIDEHGHGDVQKDDPELHIILAKNLRGEEFESLFDGAYEVAIKHSKIDELIAKLRKRIKVYRIRAYCDRIEFYDRKQAFIVNTVLDNMASRSDQQIMAVKKSREYSEWIESSIAEIEKFSGAPDDLIALKAIERKSNRIKKYLWKISEDQRLYHVVENAKDKVKRNSRVAWKPTPDIAFRHDPSIPLSCSVADVDQKKRVVPSRIPTRERIVKLIEKDHSLKRISYFTSGKVSYSPEIGQ